jgi:Fe-S-cluster containining protein
MAVFICKKCGECCKFFPEHCLPLRSWEVKNLNVLAKEKGIKLNILPVLCYFDKKSKIAFCMGYGMYNEPCPFLVESNCSIYEDRPLICKIYPVFNYLPIINATPKFNFFSNFGKCSNNDPKEIFKQYITDNQIYYNLNELNSKFKEIYGFNYLYSYQNSIINYYENYCFTILKKNNLIDHHRIKKSNISNYKIVSFMDFLCLIGFKTKVEIEQSYNSFKTLKKIEDI